MNRSPHEQKSRPTTGWALTDWSNLNCSGDQTFQEPYYCLEISSYKTKLYYINNYFVSYYGSGNVLFLMHLTSGDLKLIGQFEPQIVLFDFIKTEWEISPSDASFRLLRTVLVNLIVLLHLRSSLSNTRSSN